MVAADLRRRGHRVLFPYGEDCDYDLVAERPDGRFERVQVKYTESDGAVVRVRCRSFSLTNGKVRTTKKYTAKTIDWLAVFDVTSAQCYYVPATDLGEGRSYLHLRLTPALSGRKLGIHHAADYLSF